MHAPRYLLMQKPRTCIRYFLVLAYLIYPCYFHLIHQQIQYGQPDHHCNNLGCPQKSIETSCPCKMLLICNWHASLHNAIDIHPLLFSTGSSKCNPYISLSSLLPLIHLQMQYRKTTWFCLSRDVLENHLNTESPCTKWLTCNAIYLYIGAIAAHHFIFSIESLESNH